MSEEKRNSRFSVTGRLTDDDGVMCTVEWEGTIEHIVTMLVGAAEEHPQVRLALEMVSRHMDKMQPFNIGDTVGQLTKEIVEDIRNNHGHDMNDDQTDQLTQILKNMKTQGDA